MISYKRSEVLANGVSGTTYSNYGGIGLGYRMPHGDVVQSGGNGWFFPACEFGGLKEFVADGGKGYMDAIRGLAGGKK